MSENEIYMVKVNINGNWVPVILDDKIPIKDLESEEPFVLKSKNHENGLKAILEDDENLDNQPNLKEKLGKKIDKVEIWPQLVAKALAKSHLNYERMLTKKMSHFLRNLTGMPVKEYTGDRVDFNMLRACFKREHIVVGEAKPNFLGLVKRLCEVGNVDDENMKYWTVNHVISLGEDSQLVELTHPQIQTIEEKGKNSPYIF